MLPQWFEKRGGIFEGGMPQGVVRYAPPSFAARRSVSMAGDRARMAA
jgi:hypothetical protein